MMKGTDACSTEITSTTSIKMQCFLPELRSATPPLPLSTAEHQQMRQQQASFPEVTTLALGKEKGGVPG